jgi:hypothetical protein
MAATAVNSVNRFFIVMWLFAAKAEENTVKVQSSRPSCVPRTPETGGEGSGNVATFGKKGAKRIN